MRFDKVSAGPLADNPRTTNNMPCSNGNMYLDLLQVGSRLPTRPQLSQKMHTHAPSG